LVKDIKYIEILIKILLLFNKKTTNKDNTKLIEVLISGKASGKTGCGAEWKSLCCSENPH
jgi:phage terminase large subunit-like protein